MPLKYNHQSHYVITSVQRLMNIVNIYNAAAAAANDDDDDDDDEDDDDDDDFVEIV